MTGHRITGLSRSYAGGQELSRFPQGVATLTSSSCQFSRIFTYAELSSKYNTIIITSKWNNIIIDI
jgi:hypothetical protein